MKATLEVQMSIHLLVFLKANPLSLSE